MTQAPSLIQRHYSLAKFRSRCVPSATLMKLLNHMIKIWVSGAKAPCKPVSTPLGNSHAVGDHLKLTSLAERHHGINAEALLNEGHETRDLGFVVLSRRARNYLDLHCSVLRFASWGRLAVGAAGRINLRDVVVFAVFPPSNRRVRR